MTTPSRTPRSGGSRRTSGGQSGRTPRSYSSSSPSIASSPNSAAARSSAFGVRAFRDGTPSAALDPAAQRSADPAARPRQDSGRPQGSRDSQNYGRPQQSRDAGRDRQGAGTGAGSTDRAPRRRRASQQPQRAMSGPLKAVPSDVPLLPQAVRTTPLPDAALSTKNTGRIPAATTVAADAAITTTFAELGVPAALIRPLAELGAITPFPIQAATLPTTLTGRDVLGRGRTGSGKTIAFAVPLVTRLTGGRSAARRPRGLILLPTRELALQVQRTVEPLAKAVGLRTATVFGGVGFNPQVSALRGGVDIVIACPGRLEDLIKRGDCDLGAVEVTVLDEADHMADLGFLPVVRRLLRATPRNGQRLLFSATLDNGVSVLVDDFLTDPAVHAVDEENSPISTMTHHVFAVGKDDRTQVIRELAAGGGRRMLFTRTKYGAKKWAAALSKSGIPAVDLHGNLAQNARERNLEAFSTGSAKVLVATDIAARGIHVDDVELVVHLDPPTEHKAYLHRSGRTARAGAGGTVITVMLPEQADDVRKLMKQAGISAKTVSVRPGDAAIARLAG